MFDLVKKLIKKMEMLNFGDMSKSSKCNIGITDEKISYIGGEKISKNLLMLQVHENGVRKSRCHL